MKDIYSEQEYQKDLPLQDHVGTSNQKPATPEIQPAKPKEKPEPRDLSALEFLGQIILIGFAVLVGILLIKALGNYLIDRKRRPQKQKLTEEQTPSYSRLATISEELSAETLDYVDSLAQKGEFEAAIRALLFCCFKHIRDSYQAVLPPALTNREILALGWLHPDISRQLAVIVGTEELTQFGGRSAGISEFNKCREAFMLFVQPGAKGGTTHG
ncbi:hypothetical protein O4H49_18365 [Kiloniella laminariae]|uniref:DUF4129 domain-containing protein n=1 Tax=Kiloniella laminariae TaxID=454162 RepID=A0ABT4LNS2_9PROT|nr:hypothetical protein [Kiloniella laminariae]MCZ4282754.1 hypothetical protein [Kiloniella laminariae]